MADARAGGPLFSAIRASHSNEARVPTMDTRIDRRRGVGSGTCALPTMGPPQAGATVDPVIR